MNIDTRQLADGGRPPLLPSAVNSGESFFAAGGAGARLERPLRQSAGGGDGPVYANASRIDGGIKYQPPPAYTPSSAEERVRPRPNDQSDQSSRSQLSNIRYAPYRYSNICILCVVLVPNLALITLLNDSLIC